MLSILKSTYRTQNAVAILAERILFSARQCIPRHRGTMAAHPVRFGLVFLHSRFKRRPAETEVLPFDAAVRGAAAEQRSPSNRVAVAAALNVYALTLLSG